MANDWSEAKARRVLKAAFGPKWAYRYLGRFGAHVYCGRYPWDGARVTGHGDSLRASVCATIRAAERAGIPINAKWKEVANG